MTPSVGWGVLHLYYRVDRERASGDAGAGKPITLRYAIDINGEASWHATDPSTPDVKPRVYDRQNCMPRANSKRPER